MTLGCFEHKFYLLCIKTEFQKITDVLDTTSDDKDFPRSVTKKWIEVYDQSGKNYNPNKEIRIKTSMLRSDLCDMMHMLSRKELLLLLIQMVQKQQKRCI